MSFSTPENAEYAAVVIRVPAAIPLAGRDRIVGIPIYGRQAIVSKDEYAPGDLALYFGPETQLSQAYTRTNNLFRDATLNADPGKTGYFEPNRRVRAIKFAGHRSDAMLMPMHSLLPLGIDPTRFSVGDIFDTVDGIEICRKYTIPRKAKAANVQAKRDDGRVSVLHFPQHVSTHNWWRERNIVDDYDQIIVTQKLHGTSLRAGRVPVKLDAPTGRRARLALWAARRYGIPVQTHAYGPVHGSRRVIKSVETEQNHYYGVDADGVDLWTRYGSELDNRLPDGVIVYGELVGWVDRDTPIQRGYTYDLLPGQAQLFIYRVTRINEQGYQTDLSWDQVVEFCGTVGLNAVPLLWRGLARDFNVDEWMDTRYHDLDHLVQALPLSDPKLPDEGVVIRRDGLTPTLLKAKSPQFLQHETKLLDAGDADIESAESDAAVAEPAAA
ncbi:hypothetical protein IU485_27700 [Nocardia cyriacigeorgica]|uniref:RNA ligase family protein n=1 Tax=Nocardia cyriacigeorgica TaxID=135487 RepID=UPI0018947C39|nr:RNA ligase family protein [Nocardia cyriacigeorgica]MBF6085162.1 hypothetical protein [Nocardia cyriacigeorgica]